MNNSFIDQKYTELYDDFYMKLRLDEDTQNYNLSPLRRLSDVRARDVLCETIRLVKNYLEVSNNDIDIVSSNLKLDYLFVQEIAENKHNLTFDNSEFEILDFQMYCEKLYKDKYKEKFSEYYNEALLIANEFSSIDHIAEEYTIKFVNTFIENHIPVLKSSIRTQSLQGFSVSKISRIFDIPEIVIEEVLNENLSEDLNTEL